MSTKRDFLDISDWSREELIVSLDLAGKLKSGEMEGSALLAGKSLAMIFRKSSTRTRVSFEVGTDHVRVDAAFVRERLKDLAEDEDLRRFIL